MDYASKNWVISLINKVTGIVESGSNSYGEYALFGNGMVICWGIKTPSAWDGSSLYFDITSPYEFDDLTYSTGFSFATGNGAFSLHGQLAHVSTTLYRIVFYIAGGTYAQINLSFIMIGKAAV